MKGTQGLLKELLCLVCMGEKQKKNIFDTSCLMVAGEI